MQPVVTLPPPAATFSAPFIFRPPLNASQVEDFLELLKECEDGVRLSPPAARPLASDPRYEVFTARADLVVDWGEAEEFYLKQTLDHYESTMDDPS